MLSTARLLHILRREAPDIVHLQCINGYFVNIFRLVRWLKRHRIPTLLTLHAEFPYTANCGIAAELRKVAHRLRQLPAAAGADRLPAV